MSIFAIENTKKEFLLLNSKFGIRNSKLLVTYLFVIPSVLYTCEP